MKLIPKFIVEHFAEKTKQATIRDIFDEIQNIFLNNPKATYLVWENPPRYSKRFILDREEWVYPNCYRYHVTTQASPINHIYDQLKYADKKPSYLDQVLVAIEPDESKNAGGWVQSIRSKLRAGQGYKVLRPFQYSYGKYLTITADNVDLDSYPVEPEFMDCNDYLKIIPEDPTFNPKHVFTADEDVIKRQHRQLTEFKRWVIVKELKNATDAWVYKLTPTVTGKGPTRYFALDIDVDTTAMAGMTINLETVLNQVLDELLLKTGFNKTRVQYERVGKEVEIRLNVDSDVSVTVHPANINTFYMNARMGIVGKFCKQNTYPTTCDTEPFYYVENEVAFVDKRVLKNV